MTVPSSPLTGTEWNKDGWFVVVDTLTDEMNDA